MKKMIIFEPAMCCSTGVCGPSVEPDLLRISTVVGNLAANGVMVERYNLTNNPQIFIDNKEINEIIKKDGVDSLPVTMVDGKVVKTKSYPSTDEMLDWIGVAKTYKFYMENNTPGGGCGSGCSC